MVRRGGHFLCIERRSPDDGVIGKRTIDDKESDLLSELLRICPNGHG